MTVLIIFTVAVVVIKTVILTQCWLSNFDSSIKSIWHASTHKYYKCHHHFDGCLKSEAGLAGFLPHLFSKI